MSQARIGHGVTLREVPQIGTVLNLTPGNKWRHPWQITPAWIAGSGRWTATIKPGFVNHKAPIWRTTIANAKKDGTDYGKNQLSGESLFSSSVFGDEAPTGDERVVDVPLYLGPAIPLSFRALGFDSAGGEAVPPFFLERDVQPSLLPELAANPFGFDVNKLDELPKNARMLRVCDVWLHQPRAALTSSVSVEPGVVTGIFTLKQVLGERPAMAGDALQVMVGEFDPLAVPSIDAVGDNYEEFPWDELPIGKVYLLSQPGEKPGADPDGTWQPFVAHSLFWNLMYRQTAFVQPQPEPNAPFIVTLAGGLAQPIINYLTSSLNDGLERVFNVLQGHSLAGRFWTATGGGTSVSQVPVSATAADNFGMNKTARLLAEQRARLARKTSSSLDPRFPFRAVPVDPGVFVNPRNAAA